jgi:hypothetical protein
LHRNLKTISEYYITTKKIKDSKAQVLAYSREIEDLHLDRVERDIDFLIQNHTYQKSMQIN